MAYDLSALKILVVDDSPHMHQILRSILSAMRIKDVQFVADNKAALDELARGGADILVTDLIVGEESGLDLVRAIRAGEGKLNPYIPVILLTGHTERQRITAARDAGVNEILAKPVSVENLYRRIVSIVVNPRPFVKTGRFFGPCRRRQLKTFDGDERRGGDEAAKAAAKQTATKAPQEEAPKPTTPAGAAA